MAPLLGSLFKIYQIATLVLAGLCFYTNVRIGSLTVFDVLAAGYCALLLPYLLLSGDRKFVSEHRWPVVGLGMFVLATLASASVTYDTNDHLVRSSVLAADAVLLIAFSYAVFKVAKLSFSAVQQALVLSSALTAAVVIAQGKLGLFLGFMKTQQLEFWTRPSGLVEHPVEAGLVAAYGTVFAVGLILDRKQVLLNGASLLVIAYSETISASLTGFICSIGGVMALLMMRGAIKIPTLILGSTIALVLAIFFADSLSGTFFAERLSELSKNGLQYETLNSRSSQLTEVIDLILSNASNALLGLGYDPDIRIGGLEIHNGLLAAWYHFGVIGAASQLIFIGYFLSAAIRRTRNETALAITVFGIFLLFYLSGPAFFRRSNWMPVFLITEYYATKGFQTKERFPGTMRSSPIRG